MSKMSFEECMIHTAIDATQSESECVKTRGRFLRDCGPVIQRWLNAEKEAIREMVTSDPNYTDRFEEELAERMQAQVEAPLIVIIPMIIGHLGVNLGVNDDLPALLGRVTKSIGEQTVASLKIAMKAKKTV